MKKRKAAAKSKTLKLFKDRFVSITIKDVKSRTVRGRITNTAFVGYLSDEDKDNYFLSQEVGGMIYAAVPKSQSAGIVATDEVQYLMENIEPPHDTEVQ